MFQLKHFLRTCMYAHTWTCALCNYLISSFIAIQFSSNLPDSFPPSNLKQIHTKQGQSCMPPKNPQNVAALGKPLVHIIHNCCVLQLNCPAAMERIKEGRPITIRDDKGNTSKCIADIVSVRALQTLYCLISNGIKQFVIHTCILPCSLFYLCCYTFPYHCITKTLPCKWQISSTKLSSETVYFGVTAVNCHCQPLDVSVLNLNTKHHPKFQGVVQKRTLKLIFWVHS